ncbi:MAG TPA: amino acid adenylation domain-containing protein, partial [Thermoanaerobaculia bacterium]|nr:amino acid adenylation domain-containing protein [Thermoanaerobaculia bacterium]
ASLEAWAHPDVPFETLVADLAPGRDLRSTPLVQTLFTLQAEPLRLRLPGLSAAVEELDTGTAKFDLTLSLVEEMGGLAGTLEYDAGLFEAATIARLAGHLRVLLAAAVAGPESRIGDLPLLTREERHQLAEWSPPPPPGLPAVCPHELFERWAAEKPDAVAVVSGGESLTYGELDRRAGGIARRLRRVGVGPEVLVGLCVEPGLDLVTGMIAVFKAGGAYVPLDPGYPRQRLAQIAEGTGLGVVLAQRHAAAALPEGGFRTIFLEESGTEEGARPASGVTSANLAYLIHTSGSTGRPKGVAIAHGSVVHLLGIARWRGLGEGDVWALVHSSSFDISVWETWGCLGLGGRLVVVPRAVIQAPGELARVLREEEVTVFTQTPAALRHLAEAGELAAGRTPALRLLISGGEAFPQELTAELLAWGPEVWDLYGPTETTVWAAGGRVEGGDGTASLGGALPGYELHVLDRNGHLLPLGVAGELHAGGPGLTRGYFRDPAATAEKLVPHVGGRPGERLYRTGDLARRLPDGRLELLGRIDHQVKVRGFRIEPGEIEVALLAHPGVARVAVVAPVEPGGGRRLVAFFVPRAGAKVTGAELRTALRESLPEHMVPAALVELPELPLSPSGKVDRKALLERVPVDGSDGEVVSAPPRTPVEELVAGLWSSVLGIERIGRSDNFFALGGHSLLATRVLSRLHGAFGVDLPLRAVFEEPTVAGLATRVQAVLGGGRGGAPLAPPLVPMPRPARPAGGLPLSFAQQRLWFLQQLAPESAFYNMPAALRLTGPLDEPALERSFDEIVGRHEALRTRFPLRGDRPEQVIDPPERRPLPVVDLLGLPAAVKEDEAARLSLLEARHAFDLACGPLLRTVLLRLEPESHLLLVDMHHVVSDGWSIAVLYQDFAALYGAFAAGRPSPLPPLPVQYADFTLWQREWLQGEVLQAELDHWRRRLADPPPPDLPADRPRPAAQSFRGGTLRFAIPRQLTEELRRLARDRGVTLFMALLAGFKALVQRYTGREDVALGSPIANRDRAEIERLVGFFVNTLVLRTDLSGEPGFRELAARVREVCLDAYAHQALPFERLVEELEPERDLARQPLFGTMFQLLEMPPESVAVGPLTLERLEVETGTAAFDLALDLVDGPEGILVKAVHSADLFDTVTIRRLLEHYISLLAAVAGGDERPVVEIEILSPAERHQLLAEWNEQPAAPSEGKLLHEGFAAQVERAPDVVAVALDEQSLTYGELARRARRLAHRLRAVGIGPEVPVAVSLERSPEMVTSLLGVLESGGVYLPLDPALPRERQAFLLEDSGADIVIATAGTARRLPPSGARHILIDKEEDGADGAAPPLPAIDPASLAYVIYTSGSTGRPKGVGVSHAAASAHCRAVARFYGLGPEDCVLQFASASFDVSFEEILPTLGSGARIRLRPAQGWSPAELLQRLADFGLTVVGLPTAFWHQLAEEAERGTPPQAGHRIRLMVAGGEAMPAEALRRWHAGPLAGIPLLNAYGPTEAVVTSTAADLSSPEAPATGRVPIGRPLAGRTVQVMDRRGAPVPMGVAGELWIGGPLLARGYLGRPELTAER